MTTPGVGYAAGYNDYMEDIDLYEYAAMNGPWGGRLPVRPESDHEQKKQAQDRMVIETVKVGCNNERS